MDNIISITSSQAFVVTSRIFISVILAAILGLERSAGNKPAGFKTHILLGLSATIVMLMGEMLAKTYGSMDPTRLAAQILTGIGFIGAGTILRDGTNVKGLTTAASVLMVTCIGLSVGAGLYLIAIIATVVAFIVLKYTTSIAQKVGSMNEIEFRIITRDIAKNLPEIEKVCSENDMIMLNIQKVSSDKYELLVNGKINDTNAVISKLFQIEGIEEVADTKEIN